jgi:hypothetical protein
LRVWLRGFWISYLLISFRTVGLLVVFSFWCFVVFLVEWVGWISFTPISYYFGISILTIFPWLIITSSYSSCSYSYSSSPFSVSARLVIRLKVNLISLSFYLYITIFVGLSSACFNFYSFSSVMFWHKDGRIDRLVWVLEKACPSFLSCGWKRGCLSLAGL